MTARNSGFFLLSALMCASACTCGQPPSLDLDETQPEETTVGARYSRTFTVSGGDAPFVFEAEGLPPGLAIGAGTGTLAGTATEAGDFTVTIRVTDARRQTASGTLPFKVYPAPRITTTELPGGNVGVPYAQTLRTEGGKPPLTLELATGSLPPGLMLAGSAISGTPTANGSFSFTVKVSDSLGGSGQTTFTLPVFSGGPPRITTATLPYGVLGRSYGQVLAAADGVPPYRWTLSSGALPPGLTLLPSGLISGAPTATGASAFEVSLTDANGQSATKALAISVVEALQIGTSSLPDGYLGESYSAPLAASGGFGALTWALAGGTLPPGIILASDGRLSGSATASGSYAFTVSVSDGSGQVSSVGLVISTYRLPAITNLALQDGSEGTAYSQALQVAGGKAPYSFRVAAGALPAGLSLMAGTVAGTPSAAGQFTFTIEVADANGRTGSKEFSVTIYTGLGVATNALPDAYTGIAFSQGLVASGGAAPYSWSITLGALPPGIVLASDGTLSGTPTASGTFSFVVQVRDGSSQTASKGLSVVVYAPPALTTATLPDGYVGDSYAATLSASGGKAPLAYSVSSGSLPPGLSLSSSGNLGGTPSSAGSSTFTAQVADANGVTASRPLTIAVFVPPALTTTALADGYVGEAYSQTLSASGGRTPYRFELASGALPAGLSLSSGGTISGTPTAASTVSVSIRVVDANGKSATSTLPLAIYALPSVTTATLADAYRGVAYDQTLAASGGKGSLTFALTTGALPAGLSLSSAGRISGTPTAAAASASFTVSVTDANGRVASRALTLAVYAPVQITTTTLPDAYLTESYSQTLAATGGKEPLTWTVDMGSLPSGITLSSAGVISGTASSAEATFTFAVKANDANGQFAVQTLALAVYALPAVTSMSLPSGTVGVPYSRALMASGGKSPLTWSHSGGSLPPGLSVSSSGLLAGTPTQAGSWAFSVQVTDANGRTASAGLDVLISAASVDAGPAFVRLANWNVEWFGDPSNGPTDDALQLANVRDVIRDGGYEVWGMVEVVNTSTFASLVSQLPGYSGLVASDPSVVQPPTCFGSSPCYTAFEQKPALLFKNSVATVLGAQLILTGVGADGGDYDYWFAGRPPLRVDVRLTSNGVTADVVMIVLHLKAFSDWSSYLRRQSASLALKDYLDNYLPTQKVIVLGDWNDDVDRSITRDGGIYVQTPFLNLVQDQLDYRYVTEPLSDAGVHSTVSNSEFIDHQVLTNELLALYQLNSAQVVRPDLWGVPSYGTTTSDHYPVVSKYDLTGGANPPSDAGSPPGGPFINEVLYTETRSLPDGGRNFNEEFVEVVNAGGGPVDLTGWTIWDSSIARHGFDAGTVLLPGKAIVVFGGASAIPPGLTNAVAASSGTLSLHPADTVTLRNPSGTTVDSHSWAVDQDAGISVNRSPDGNPDAGFLPHDVVSPGRGQSPGTRADGGSY